MTPTITLLSLLVAFVPTATAWPIASGPQNVRKRDTSPRNVSIGFAIAISVLIFASVIFFLGVQRGRTGTWFCWREPLPSFRPCSPSENTQVIDTDTLKSRISSPLQMHSSALPELSPVEAQPRFAELSPMGATPKALELATSEKAVFEMGLASPRRPPSVISKASKSSYSSRKSSIATAYRKSVASVKTTGKSVYSTSEKPPKVNSWFDRKSWFCRGAMEIEDEEKRMRGDEAAEGPSACTLAPPTTAVVASKNIGEIEGRATMDWSGMEWLTKVYDGRKSRRLSGKDVDDDKESGMKSFYIPGSDEK
ncbi:hypothetical protein BU23DRAFT_549019 [Bimuria novae-zelandiae CBS 107.79]|uniref:Uncharacterized protein n=1 Tax=Bimuria novae-zelandiae CBS 107.79 TaxID=1447943 RepID=A0A6A5VSE3_9PLEO|nr:hypothetical protein BU23DRAFT_549019 [Bimuria novae-zelandiae CBS 107.79]